MSTPQTPRRTVCCPRCGGPSLYAPENPARPFCSERCRTQDFGAWASESYRVAGPPAESSDLPLQDDRTGS
jgi:endogenous inhibitor of DNA gyrase (YacG/DUF329 family)